MCYYNMFGKKVSSMLNILLCSDAGTEGVRGATGLPIFGRSVNPIPTGGGHIIPTYYYWPLIFFTFRHHCLA